MRAVDDYTGFPEILDGRVKTLHPRIYAGLLALRSSHDHVTTLNEHGIEPIDLVCVNLYPFERVAAQRGREDAEVIENIDIGGPTLIRAAAKNHEFAAVVVSPESYDAVLEELTRGRRDAVRAHARRPWRWRRSPTRPATTRRSRAGSPSARRISRSPTRARSRRCSTSPTARTRTSAPPTTPSLAPARTCCRWSRSCTARSSRSTTCSTSTRRGASWRTSSSRPRRSSSTTIPAAAGVGSSVEDAFDKALAGRPAERLRRGVLLQQAGQPGARREAARAVRGAGVRARLRRRRARAAREQAERAAAPRPGAPPPADLGARHEAGARRAARAGPRRRPPAARGDERGHGAQAGRVGVGRAAVRDARVPGTCAPTRSCSPASWRPWASARAR